MKFLVRFFIFLSFLCSLAFSKNGDNGYYYVMRDYNLPSTFVPADAKFLKDNKYIGFRMPVYDMYEVVSYRIRQDAFYFDGSKSPGFYRNSSYSLYFIGGTPKTGRFGPRGSIGDYERYVLSDNPKDPIFTYYTFLEFDTDRVAKCKLYQEFNTDTMQCVDPCPAGQLWNVKSNSCVVDCTDEDNHKFFTSDYTCIDCSSALTIDDIARCYCSGLGSSYNPGYAWDPNNPNVVQAHCKDERLITFKFDKSKEDQNKEKDKDKEDPNKDKEKDKDKDKDKEDPNKDKNKDNNNSTPGNGNNGGSSGGGSSGGTGGGSSGGNNGGSGSGSGGGTGGGSSGGNNQGNGGQGGGQGNNGNSENATPGNIDYGELEERTADLANTYKENINNLFEPIDGIKKSLNDTISKIKDGNLMSLKKGGIPNTCPLNFDIDMVFFSKKVVFDFCSILSPIASSLYVFFFVAFFLLFLFLIAKLFIFTFMGW